jgi:choline dehydrogenase-like flavoprotein
MRRPVVVIGGGTSGSTVAALLAATTTREIVLVESGNASTHDDEPRFMDVISEHNTPSFAMVTLVEGGVAVPYVQAHALGGGSAVNGMILSGEPPESVEGLTRLAQIDEMGSVSRALLAAGGTPSRLWWNGGRWNPGRAVQHLVEEGRISIVKQDAVLLTGDSGAVHEVHTEQSVIATDHVVMCAGAIATPMLLLSSGMGAVNPQIGVGLQDHPTIAFTMARADDELGVFDASVHLKGGTTGGGRFIVLAYERVSREASCDALVTVSLMTPTSRGAVQMNDGELSVNMNMLSTESDVCAMRESVRELVRVCKAPSVQRTTKSIVIDDWGTGLHDLEAMADLELDQWIRGNLSFVSHASSSCASAIDAEGGLQGFSNVTIADASGLAMVPSETPAASVTMEATRIGRSLGGKLA